MQEEIRPNRRREDPFSLGATIEAEKSAKFGRRSRSVEKKSFSDLLLGPEFDDDQGGSKKVFPGDILVATTSAEGAYSTDLQGEVDVHAKDWTCSQLPPNVISELEAIEILSISVQRPSGGDHKVVLGSRELSMLRGSSSSSDRGVLSWLDDNVIDGFTALINSRSEKFVQVPGGFCQPSRNPSLFNRRRVRSFVFSTHFFSIWSRKQNGGYNSVQKWRRKIPNYNSVGLFMFPALVHGNHWVLAVIDIDGQQFMYYDPQGRMDNSNVMHCAQEWMSGEIRTASRGDAFKGLRTSSWPVHYNPWRLPVQKDLQSCGVFVLYVAEHIERGIIPRFDQSDISALRLRTLQILSQGLIPNHSSSELQINMEEK